MGEAEGKGEGREWCRGVDVDLGVGVEERQGVVRGLLGGEGKWEERGDVVVEMRDGSGGGKEGTKLTALGD